MNMLTAAALLDTLVTERPVYHVRAGLSDLCFHHSFRVAPLFRFYLVLRMWEAVLAYKFSLAAFLTASTCVSLSIFSTAYFKTGSYNLCMVGSVHFILGLLVLLMTFPLLRIFTGCSVSYSNVVSDRAIWRF